METQTEQINELLTALAKAQGKFEHAKKITYNTFFKNNYADLKAVIDAAKPGLAENNLSVIQIPRYRDNTLILATRLCHSSGQWIEGEYPVLPVKNDPQSYGSAFTYARRYGFAAIVGIASEEEDDDDANTASDDKGIIEFIAKASERINNAATLEELQKVCKEITEESPASRPQILELYASKKKSLTQAKNATTQ